MSSPSATSILVGMVLLAPVCLGATMLRKPEVIATTYEQGRIALDRIKDWAAWMTGIQTAALAALGFWLDRREVWLPESWQSAWVLATMVAFGFSILVATWVLACLPSLELRLVEAGKVGVTDQRNDAFELPINTMALWQWLKLGALATLFHTYFLAGALCFGAFVFSELGSAPPPKDKTECCCQP